jgi:hypothetical protein
MSDREFEHPVEGEPSTAGLAAVEAEHELIQVVLEVRLVEPAMVGSEQPSLG